MNLNKAKHKFKDANDLCEEGNYDQAITIYQGLLLDNSYNQFEILIQLGGAYFFSKRYSESCTTYKSALDIDPISEIASLGFYLSCTKLDKLHEGLLEMQRYFRFQRPKLFRDTIEELLKGLENGYGTDCEDIILGFKKLL